ncbi:hypothetical protein Aperf_G00000051438 [Anoplocephala perfoliata]
MQARSTGEHSFRSDLIIARNCESPSCQRVAEHSEQLLRVAVLLKSYLIQQHQAQNSLNFRTRYDHADGVSIPSRSEYAALQRQVEVGLAYQREVQQLRREIEVQREAANNYKQLFTDGNLLREDLRNELNLARKSASVARAALEEERRNHVRPKIAVNSIVPESSPPWLEFYKEENTKLREAVRVLTDKEINLTSTLVRLKEYVEEESDRLIRSEGLKMERSFSGAWFMGLLGLLGLPCPSNLAHYLTAPPTPPFSKNRLQSPRNTRQRSPSKTMSKDSSALQSILNELKVVEAPKAANRSSVSKLRPRKRSQPISSESPLPFPKSKNASNRKRGRKVEESSVFPSPEKGKQSTRGRRLSASSSDSSLEDVLTPKKLRLSAKQPHWDVKASEFHQSSTSSPRKSTVISDPTVANNKSECDHVTLSVQQLGVDLDDLDTSAEIEVDSLAGKNEESMSIVSRNGGSSPFNSLLTSPEEKCRDKLVMSKTNSFDEESSKKKEELLSGSISPMHTSRSSSEKEPEASEPISVDILAEKSGNRKEPRRNGAVSPVFPSLSSGTSESTGIESPKADSADEGKTTSLPFPSEVLEPKKTHLDKTDYLDKENGETGILNSPTSLLSSQSSDVNKKVENGITDFSDKKNEPLEKRAQKAQLHRTMPLSSLSSLTDVASAERIKTLPCSIGPKRKKTETIPSSLEDIITRRFSKSIFNWFDTLTTYQGGDGGGENKEFSPQPSEAKSSKKRDSHINIIGSVSKPSPSLPPKSPERPSGQVIISPACVSPQSKSPEISANEVETATSKHVSPDADPPRSCLPLGSCVAMESGIVTSSQPHSLLHNLIDYLIGKQAFAPSSTPPNIAMDLICDALTQALELISQSNLSPSLFPPPEPVLRAAALLNSAGKSSEMSAFALWFRVRLHLTKKKRRCPPKPPLLLFRLAQTAYLTCDVARRSDLLYQLATFLAFNGYASTPTTCLLLAFQFCPSSPPSSLELVYQFLAWKEAEDCSEVNEFVSALRQSAFWSEKPPITSLRYLLSTLVDDFCYGKKGLNSPEHVEDTTRALRLLLTVHAFTELDVKKSAANRFGLTGWLLKARLLSWINNLAKNLEKDESTIKLLLRVCSLSVDVILLATQLDIRRSPSNPPKTKVLLPCQRGLLFCCDKIFEVLASISTSEHDQTPAIIFCLLRLTPCLTEEQITKLRDILLGLHVERLFDLGRMDLPSILPPLQNSFIAHTLDRLELSQRPQLVQALKKILCLDL